MRSIRYILGSDPCNTDDCIDYMSWHTLHAIDIRLIVQEYATEIYISNELCGIFSWQFTDNTFSYKDQFGACFWHELEFQQKRSVDNANGRLKNFLDRINYVIKQKGYDAIITVEPSFFAYDKSIFLKQNICKK